MDTIPKRHLQRLTELNTRRDARFTPTRDDERLVSNFLHWQQTGRWREHWSVR